MFNSKYEKKQFGLKVLKLLEGWAGRDEFEEVQDTLRESPEARALYKKYVNVYSTLKEINISSIPKIDDELAEKIIEAEKRAPAIRKCRQEKEKQSCLIEDVHYDIPKRQYSRSSVIAFVLSAAAMLAIVLILTFADRTNQSIRAAVVEDALNAQFSDSTVSFSSGDSIWANNKVSLSEGYIELKTPNDVLITVEAPAEFDLSKQSDLQLDYGRIYAKVGDQGIGFTVHTDNMRLIDLGTEFGVYKDKKGWTEAHMIKGKAAFIGGSWLNRSKLELTKGKALGISGGNSDAVEINSEPEKFARSITSQYSAIWRGQETLDLADMVGGGNGLGTGKYKSGIVTIKGEYSDDIEDFEQILLEYKDYLAVEAMPLIDGVFMPDGGRGPVKVSSQGHTFSGLPDTDVRYRAGLLNGAYHPRVGSVLPHVMTLQGVKQTYPENSAIYIHPEQGVTFDLKNIREIVPDSRISRFTAKFGLSDSIFNDAVFAEPEKWQDKSGFKSIVCDMQVLVDGKLRFEVNNQTPVDKPVDFDIRLNPKDRFLTICSFVPMGKGAGNAGLAMPLFVNPKLHLDSLK
ncbi:FecR domain-containing protein [Sedimentisphaera salicampi]|uniref:FecR domain-containing protein n=1 Tax=Sedimentisphaera salicampi TaxID=1941349 RepID=UPI000B9A45C4|nr:FecR domain-containing protein [Sedimentisphaera salicampi]OXU15610.1 FecR protein [Sedimentisphaera salicampi]